MDAYHAWFRVVFPATSRSTKLCPLQPSSGRLPQFSTQHVPGTRSSLRDAQCHVIIPVARTPLADQNSTHCRAIDSNGFISSKSFTPWHQPGHLEASKLLIHWYHWFPSWGDHPHGGLLADWSEIRLVTVAMLHCYNGHSSLSFWFRLLFTIMIQ